MADRVAVRAGGRTLPFFLEWEKRAMNPSTMSARLARYLRCCYFSNRPLDGHGHGAAGAGGLRRLPGEGNILGVARIEMECAVVDVPLWVSYRQLLEQVGAMGLAWRSPDVLEPSCAFTVTSTAEAGRMANPRQVPGRQRLAKAVEPKSPGG